MLRVHVWAHYTLSARGWESEKLACVHVWACTLKRGRLYVREFVQTCTHSCQHTRAVCYACICIVHKAAYVCTRSILSAYLDGCAVGLCGVPCGGSGGDGRADAGQGEERKGQTRAGGNEPRARHGEPHVSVSDVPRATTELRYVVYRS